MNNWRFRTNLLKNLILQRLTVVVSESAYGQASEREQWRDASATDLQDYYTELFTFGGMLDEEKT